MSIKKLFKKITSEKGIGLIETIAALGVAIIVLTSLVSLSLYSLRFSQQSRDMLQATKLATEELEKVRAYRDTHNWSGAGNFKELMLACSTSCYVSSTGNINSGSETVSTSFTRSFTAQEVPAGSDIIRVNVTVSWPFGGVNKSVHNYSDFTNWRGL